MIDLKYPLERVLPRCHGDDTLHVKDGMVVSVLSRGQNVLDERMKDPPRKARRLTLGYELGGDVITVLNEEFDE